MSSNPKVNISISTYEKIKKLPPSQRKVTLTKAVIKAAKDMGYTQPDLLKDTTHISFKINSRYKTTEKSSEKSSVIKDMVIDIEAEKEQELKEKEKKEQEAKDQEQEKDKDESEKDKDKEQDKEKDKDKQKDEQAKEEENKPKEKNPNSLKIAITDRLLEEISGLAPEEAKNVIRANIEGQAQAQGFDVEKLHKPCGGLSINDAEKNETASASTPNGSTLLDNLVEVVYASCKGYSVEEQAQACEEGDSRHMSDKNMMEGGADMIQGMVNSQAEQEVELEQGGLEPNALAPSGTTPRRPY